MNIREFLHNTAVAGGEDLESAEVFLALEMVLDVGGLGPGHRQVTGAADHLTVRLHQLRELCNRNIVISDADP